MKVLKNIFVIVMVFLLILNVYLLVVNNKKSDEMKEIVNQNNALKKDNEEYQDKQERISNTAREQYYEDLTNRANDFIDLIYTQKTEGYQERKEEAENIMSDNLLETYYAPDEYTNQEEEISVENKDFYIEKMDKEAKEVEVLADVDHKVKYRNKDEEDISNVIVKVKFALEDDEWIATQSENIYVD